MQAGRLQGETSNRHAAVLDVCQKMLNVHLSPLDTTVTAHCVRQGAKADAKRLLKWDPTSEIGLALMSDERVKKAPWSFPWSM